MNTLIRSQKIIIVVISTIDVYLQIQILCRGFAFEHKLFEINQLRRLEEHVLRKVVPHRDEVSVQMDCHRYFCVDAFKELFRSF